MFFSKYIRCGSILPVIALVSCASQQPLSSVDRNRVKTIALNPDIKAPEHYVYRDVAGKRARAIGNNPFLGIVGPLVGAAIGASSEAPGFKRFDAAASKKPVDIRSLVRRNMEAALRNAEFFKLTNSNADMTLNIQILAYGVAPIHGHQLGGVITAKATLVGRDGKIIWKKDDWGASNTTAMLEDLEKNPSLWPQMANEAAEAVARKVILVTSKTERTVSPTTL
jgi:hypothetical protein